MPLTAEPLAAPVPHPASRLAKNAVANLLRLGTSWLIVLVVPPFLVRQLNPPAYATWMLILQIGAYTTLFDGGLQMSIARYVAQADALKDRSFFSQLLSSTTALLALIAVLCAAAVACLTVALGNLFPAIPPSLLPEARSALLLVGCSLAFTLPSSVLAGYFLGREKNEINAIAGSVSKLAGAAGTVWAAQHHHGLVAMAFWTATATLLQPVIFAIAGGSRQVLPLLRFAAIQWTAVREFSRFCVSMILTQLGTVLISGLDLPIVAAFDFHRAGDYALATTVSAMLMVPFAAILSTIVPSVARMSLQDDGSERLGDTLVRITRFASCLLVLIAVPLMAALPILLPLWVGPEYAHATLLPAELLTGAQIIRMLLTPYALVGFSAGEQGHMLISPAVEGIVNVLCSLFLAWHYGATGVAIGTVIGAVAGFVLHFTTSMPRTGSIALRRKQLLRNAMLPHILLATPVALLLAWLMPHLPLVGDAGLLIAGEALLTVLLWSVCLRPEDRDTLGTALDAVKMRAFPAAKKVDA